VRLRARQFLHLNPTNFSYALAVQAFFILLPILS
jgi:hypothetical protein